MNSKVFGVVRSAVSFIFWLIVASYLLACETAKPQPPTCEDFYTCAHACLEAGVGKEGCARTCNETYDSTCGRAICDKFICGIDLLWKEDE